MLRKLLAYYLLAILQFHIHFSSGYIDLVPMWDFNGRGPIYGSMNITSNHVTSIELSLCHDGAIFSVNVLGDGTSKVPFPNGGCT